LHIRGGEGRSHETTPRLPRRRGGVNSEVGLHQPPSPIRKTPSAKNCTLRHSRRKVFIYTYIEKNVLRQPIGLRHPTVDSSQSRRFAHQYTKIVLFNQNQFVAFSLFTRIQANACDASELHVPIAPPQNHYGANLETWPSPMSRDYQANTPTCVSCM